ncbi:prevent-host-death family protein [Burkholderia pseudomallei ABCPW 107]|nr:prevent-host-death family protein [Burkholderia pseudomallei ABCPW 107]
MAGFRLAGAADKLTRRSCSSVHRPAAGRPRETDHDHSHRRHRAAVHRTRALFRAGGRRAGRRREDHHEERRGVCRADRRETARSLSSARARAGGMRLRGATARRRRRWSR